MKTVLKQQEDIIPPRKERTKESKGDVLILVLPREAEEQTEQSLVAVCSFCRFISGADGLPCGSSHTVALSSPDIGSHSAARSFCPSALPPVWTADLGPSHGPCSYHPARVTVKTHGIATKIKRNSKIGTHGKSSHQVQATHLG